MTKIRKLKERIQNFHPLTFGWIITFSSSHPILRANRKIHDDLVSQREVDLAYIQTLQDILAANGLDIPPMPEIKEAVRLLGESQHVMQDGSFESLDRTISKLKEFINIIEIDVQYRELGFWGRDLITIPSYSSQEWFQRLEFPQLAPHLGICLCLVLLPNNVWIF